MGGKPTYNLPAEKVVTADYPYDREWEAWKRKALMSLKEDDCETGWPSGSLDAPL